MWKKILGGFVVFIALLVMLVMYATSGLTETADKFFSAMSANNYELAYNMLSEDFKKSVTKDVLKEFAHKNGFDLYKKANWGNRSVDGTRGVLEGSIETVRGTVVPVTLKMVQDEYDNWKIYAIFKPKSGIVQEEESFKTQNQPTNTSKPEPKTPNKPATTIIKPNNQVINNTNSSTNSSALLPSNSTASSQVDEDVATNINNKPKEMALPSDNELKQMVKKSFDLFAQGIKEQNLEKLYNYMSPYVHKEYSLEQINQLFSREFNYPQYFSQLLSLEPTITNKEFLPKKRKLIIKGEYQAKPNKLKYKVSYFYNNQKWELTGINFEVNNNAPNNTNVNQEYINLVKDTIHTFAVSVNDKSMEKIYQKTSNIFKEQISLERLNEIFKSFIEKNIDLTLLDNMQPIFDKKPQINQQGILELVGHYATTPATTRFGLKYIKEDGEWRLITIKVNIKK